VGVAFASGSGDWVAGVAEHTTRLVKTVKAAHRSPAPRLARPHDTEAIPGCRHVNHNDDYASTTLTLNLTTGKLWTARDWVGSPQLS
jgi:hypothetical protein